MFRVHLLHVGCRSQIRSPLFVRQCFVLLRNHLEYLPHRQFLVLDAQLMHSFPHEQMVRRRWMLGLRGCLHFGNRRRHIMQHLAQGAEASDFGKNLPGYSLNLVAGPFTNFYGGPVERLQGRPPHPYVFFRQTVLQLLHERFVLLCTPYVDDRLLFGTLIMLNFRRGILFNQQVFVAGSHCRAST